MVVSVIHLYVVPLFSVYPGTRQPRGGNCCRVNGVMLFKETGDIVCQIFRKYLLLTVVMMVASFREHFCLGI